MRLPKSTALVTSLINQIKNSQKTKTNLSLSATTMRIFEFKCKKFPDGSIPAINCELSIEEEELLKI